MRLIWELSKRSFQRHLTYRAAAIAGLVTNLFFGLLRAAILVALYGARQEMSGVSLQGAISYTGLTQALIAYLTLFGWYPIMDSVASGEVASDLLKPLDYYTFWLSQDIGRSLAALIMRSMPLMLFYAIAFDLTYPENPLQWGALIVALILSLLVSFSWRFLVNLAAFFTPNALGVGRFAFGLSWVLSGFFLPLRFHPEWFIRLAELTPFPAMVNTVVEIYLGVLSGPEMAGALLEQLIWLAILLLLGQIVLRAGVRRLVIQGG
jgi:ABC-2 type transport system permease protein